MLKSGVVVEVQQRLCCANQCNEVYVQAKKVVTIPQYHIMKFKLIFTIYLHVQIRIYSRYTPGYGIIFNLQQLRVFFVYLVHSTAVNSLNDLVNQISFLHPNRSFVTNYYYQNYLACYASLNFYYY